MFNDEYRENSDVYVNNNSQLMPGDDITAEKYNLFIGLALLWGFGINYLIVKSVPIGSLLQISPMAMVILYAIMSFIGTMMIRRSDSPLISFVGYNFIVVPLGITMSVVLAFYNPSVVLNAISATALATLVMMILGVTYPRFFQRISTALFIGVFAGLIVSIVLSFLHKDSVMLDYMFAVFFCGYIGYDFGRSSLLPKTLNNAIDSAAAIYLDIINLFIRILSILARRER